MDSAGAYVGGLPACACVHRVGLHAPSLSLSLSLYCSLEPHMPYNSFLARPPARLAKASRRKSFAQVKFRGFLKIARLFDLT